MVKTNLSIGRCDWPLGTFSSLEVAESLVTQHLTNKFSANFLEKKRLNKTTLLTFSINGWLCQVRITPIEIDKVTDEMISNILSRTPNELQRETS